MIDSALVVDKGVTARDEWITVPADRIRDALSALKKDGYRLLVFLTCVDHLVDASREFPGRYEIVYQLTREFFAQLPALARDHGEAALIDPEQAPATPIPLHAGAARYYREREVLR